MKHTLLTLLSLAAVLSAQTPADNVAPAAVSVPVAAPVASAPVVQVSGPSNEELETRLKVVERLRENDQEEQKAAKDKASKVDASSKGFRIEDAKGTYFLKVGGLVQATAQYYFDDSAKVLPNNYSLRRARLDVQTGLGKGVNFRLQTEFAPGASASLLDAYLDLQPSPVYGLRIGRFTPNIGLELTQSPVKTAFTDASLASALLPIRDEGVQLQGDIGDGTLQYAVGVFNGTQDGVRADTDTEDEKEAAGRIWVTPFATWAPSVLAGLSGGVGGSAGKQTTVPASYKSPGRNKIFGYKAADTLQGWQYRLAPQAAYFLGSFGFTSELVIEKQGLRDSASVHTARFTNKAWQYTVSYVITGEDASLKGVSPSTPINGSESGFGAVEIALRVHAFDVDNKVFQRFSDPTKNVTQAVAYAGALNWYATKNVRLTTEYSVTKFDGGAKKNTDRAQENLLTATANLNF